MDITLDKKTFDQIREIVYEKSGISLNDTKAALVSARIAKRLRAMGLSDYKQYLQIVLEDRSGEEIVNLLDVISTNVTHFFRESNHFDFMAAEFEKWVQAGQRRFRIWSAASSTGQEPYTIAMTLLNSTSARGLDTKILATDISTRALAAAVKGEYAEDKMANIPGNLKNRFFSVERGDNGEKIFQVSSEIKNMVLYRRLNLSKPPFPMRGPMDIIFCRNVMIYFDNNVRRRLLSELYRLLKPGGYLMVGHAESLTGMVSDFKVVRPSIYIKA